MSILITILNWVVIAVLAYVVASGKLSPGKGSDAPGRAMEMAIYNLAIIALIALVMLNLLPQNWAKYTALGLAVVPFLLFITRSFKRN